MSFINKGTRNRFRQSTRPEPLLPGKHALNPPIVTVIGAGVAGMTAAHELVERGFRVQVVDGTGDAYNHGRPMVGGMAANQRARVRANVEDLHRDLIDRVRQLPGKRVLVDWMLWLFSLNRTRWIQTETPETICRFIHWEPDAPKFPDVITELTSAKERYRRRWLWDLTIRGVLLESLKARFPERTDVDAVATRLYKQWLGYAADPGKMVLEIHGYLAAGDKMEAKDNWGIKLPDQNLITDNKDTIVGPAFEREFLCFRLIPCAVAGLTTADADARKLLKGWLRKIVGTPGLKNCLLVETPAEQWQNPETIERAIEQEGNDAQVIQQSEPLHERQSDTSPTAWVQVEIIEQRLPGEHGYRFFPSFYKHLDDTMKRIPLCDESGRMTGRTVYDNLKPTVFQGLGMNRQDLETLGRASRLTADLDDLTDDPHPACELPRGRKGRVVEIHRNRAKSIEGMRDRTDRFVERLGGTKRDGLLFFAKMLRYMMSSPERRRQAYEQKTWSEFVKSAEFSPPMQKHLDAAAQVLLAFSIGEADARTYGDTATQLFLDQFEDGTRTDRTLNGPTSTAWLEPWRDYLERQGVVFFHKQLEKLELREKEEMVAVEKDGVVTKELRRVKELIPKFKASPASNGETFLTDDGPDELKPDFYVLALGLPAAAAMLAPIKDQLPAEAAQLKQVVELEQRARGKFALRGREETSFKDMTGVQFFFDAKTSIGRGHMYFPLSDWGLSSISQSEFWLTRGGFSDGFLGVLSVDICTTGPTASGARSFRETLKYKHTDTNDPIEREDNDARGRFKAAQTVWEQIASRIDEKDRLADPRSFHLDTTISADRNDSLFLASTPAVRERPGRRGGDTCVGEGEIKYDLHFDRWVVCGTFMATHTRMTTMEAANESARHAVRAILERLGRRIERYTETMDVTGDILTVDALSNQKYNGAWEERPFDPPDVWNPEDYELEDLDIYRRIDRRLVELGLPHCFDILDVDRKLKLALDEAEIYGKGLDEKNIGNLGNLIGLTSASADAAATKERGRDYAQKDKADAQKLKDMLAALAGKVNDARFPGLKTGLNLDDLNLEDMLRRL